MIKQLEVRSIKYPSCFLISTVSKKSLINYEIVTFRTSCKMVMFYCQDLRCAQDTIIAMCQEQDFFSQYLLNVRNQQQCGHGICSVNIYGVSNLDIINQHSISNQKFICKFQHFFNSYSKDVILVRTCNITIALTVF